MCYNIFRCFKCENDLKKNELRELVFFVYLIIVQSENYGTQKKIMALYKYCH